MHAETAGAGFAGLAAAIALRRRGWSVRVHEKEAELRAFLEPRMAAFKIPTRFIVASEPLPKLGTGKIDRVAIKAQYRN